MRGPGRYVVLGLAPGRSSWFPEVARWAVTGTIPVEFVKCIAAEELRSRLASGRAASAVVVDAATNAVDRDLLAAATSRDVAVIVVDSRGGGRDWAELGAAAVLRPPFGRERFLEVLDAHARPVDHATAVPTSEPPAGAEALDLAPLVAVTGPGGTGASTVAMALAQGWAARLPEPFGVVLADLRLRSELALLHDAGDIVPGIQELVEAHRSRRPDADAVRAVTFRMATRGYQLLLGIRRHRDWAGLRPRALAASLDGLRVAFAGVVADIEPDLDDESSTGSVEVEDRNAMAIEAVRRATVVLAVGLPGLKGTASLARVVADLHAAGVEPGRVLPVLNRTPRRPRLRAELARTWATVAPAADGSPAPLFLPDRRSLDHVHHDGAPLPAVLAEPLAGAVVDLLARLPGPATDGEPEPVAIGSLGHLAPDIL